MLKTLFSKSVTTTTLPWRELATRHSTSAPSSVDSMVLRSLKEHYLELAKMNQPPKIEPPEGFSVTKCSLDSLDKPALRRTFENDEEINVAAFRLPNLNFLDEEGDPNDEDISQLLVHVEVAKPDQKDSLQFLCGVYHDSIGILAVAMRPRGERIKFMKVSKKYHGAQMQDLKAVTRNNLHGYLEKRGVTNELYPFLQAWLYVREHRLAMRWFKTVGTIVSDSTKA